MDLSEPEQRAASDSGSGGGIGRRRFLQAGAAGLGLAWASPVILSFDARAAAMSVPPPPPPPPANDCEVVKFTTTVGACVTYMVGAQKRRGTPFTVTAQFDGMRHTCSCCEYRQYVRGKITLFGAPYDFKLPNPMGGMPVSLSPKNFIEDGLVNPGGGNVYYGHRNEANEVIDSYSTAAYTPPLGVPPARPPGPVPAQNQRATGCYYGLWDLPSVPLMAGKLSMLDVEFKVEILDTCTNKLKRSEIFKVSCGAVG